MSETFAALAGVVLGFGLNEVAAFLRRRAEDRRRSGAAKLLIRAEGDHNIELLTRLAKTIDDEQKEDAASPANMHLPAFLGRIAIPAWSHVLWENQLAAAAHALAPEAIRRIHRFHSDLDTITELVQTIRENESQVTYRKELYDECVALMHSILAGGNPAA